MPLTRSYTDEEVMIIASARLLGDGDVCFVGIGKPSLAANVARRTHAPDLVLVYESGCIGSKPGHVPLSIGDGELALTADSVVSVPEILTYWLQAGRIDVGFLGAAQLDRSANINSTVIGRYDYPATRLPGAGGAPEIATSAKRVIVLLNHSRRTLVERCDFLTSLGTNVVSVVTNLAVLQMGDGHELELVSTHPGISVSEVRAATGWDLRVGRFLEQTPPPTTRELQVLRALTRLESLP